MSVTSSIHPTGSYLTPSLDHATVADAMHPGVLACAPDAPLADVARMMASHHVHCVAVLGVARDQTGESLAWGLITDVDVVNAGLSPGGDATARTLARHGIVTVEPATPLRSAAELMLGSGTTHILVVEPRAQQPVGVLSTLDVAGVLAWGEA